MNKGAKINAFLLSIGANPEFAYMEAQRLEKGWNGGKAPTKTKGGDALAPTVSLSDRILAYAQKRKGNVWNLSTLALALSADKNSLSAQLTHLVKSGVINRTGRAEYVLAR